MSALVALLYSMRRSEAELGSNKRPWLRREFPCGILSAVFLALRHMRDSMDAGPGKA